MSILTNKPATDIAIIAGIITAAGLPIDISKIRQAIPFKQESTSDAVGTEIEHDADAACDEDDGQIVKQNFPEVGFRK